MNNDKKMPALNLKKVLCYLSVFVIFCVITVWMRYGDSISLSMYKNKVKRYIEQQDYSETTKEILFVAVDHIQYPENISDYKKIYLERAQKLSGPGFLITDDGMENVVVDEKDWYVIIGDPGLHRYYNAIIDETTMEYLGSVPIA